MSGLPLAHGIGAVKDLPLPLWLFYYTGAIVLVVSFVALGVLWTKPRLENNQWTRALPSWLQWILLSTALRVLLGATSFGLLVLVFLAALLGEPSQGANLAPTFVFVVFWVGMVPLVVVFGNVWRVLNPWRAAADGVAWVTERLGVRWEPLAEYPERLGRWPAAALLFAFTAYELAYLDASEPRSLALAILIYSWIVWVGAAVFGRDAWFENGDGFTVYFDFLSRIAPFGVEEREEGRQVVLRPPLAALARWDSKPGTLAVVVVMLGSVAFDGFSRTATWQNRLFEIEAELIGSPGLSDLVVTGVNILGLTVAILLVVALYLAGRHGRARRRALRAVARRRVRVQPGADRVRLRAGPLLLTADQPGPVRDPACLRSVRLRLGCPRHRRLHSEPDRADAEHDLVRPGGHPRARTRLRPRAGA